MKKLLFLLLALVLVSGEREIDHELSSEVKSKLEKFFSLRYKFPECPDREKRFSISSGHSGENQCCRNSRGRRRFHPSADQRFDAEIRSFRGLRIHEVV